MALTFHLEGSTTNELYDHDYDNDRGRNWTTLYDYERSWLDENACILSRMVQLLAGYVDRIPGMIGWLECMQSGVL